MPRIGAEPVRRQSLIDAAIGLIGEQGSLEVSVKDIARRAGMSPALAFHYFGDKDAMIVATMRHLLAAYSAEVADRLGSAITPRARLTAVIEASFAPAQFDQPTIAAWLVFYLHAYSSPQARRLLDIYSRRLRSNLLAGFRPLLGDAAARRDRNGRGPDRRLLHPPRVAQKRTGCRRSDPAVPCMHRSHASAERASPAGVRP